MGLGCGMSLIKYVLFVFNLLCALGGIALLTVGVIFYTKVNEIDTLFQEHYVAWLPLTLIVLGSVIFVIAFFGCCGAIRESHCLTLSYSVCLFILIVAQIVIGALVLANKDDVNREVQNFFRDIIWAQNNDPANIKLLDILQKNLQCCGFDASNMWAPNAIPDSCYPDGSSVRFGQYCVDAVRIFINDAGIILGWVLLGVAAIQLLGFIFACCLANSIRNQERRYA